MENIQRGVMPWPFTALQVHASNTQSSECEDARDMDEASQERMAMGIPPDNTDTDDSARRGERSRALEERLDDPSKPYVPMSVEEVSLICSLERWTNPNVRVVGKLTTYDDGCHLESVLEANGPYSVAVDMDLLEVFPPVRTVIQVLGEMMMADDGKPVVKVKFFRRMDDIDIVLYDQAIQLQKKYIPLFFK